MRQFLGHIAYFAFCFFYLPGSHPMGFRKRQVMSPTMAPVPASPFTFSQLLRSQYLLLLLLPVLGLCTGTVNVPILLSSIHCRHFYTHILAQFNQTVSLSLFALATLASTALHASSSLSKTRVPSWLLSRSKGEEG